MIARWLILLTLLVGMAAMVFGCSRLTGPGPASVPAAGTDPLVGPGGEGPTQAGAWWGVPPVEPVAASGPIGGAAPVDRFGRFGGANLADPVPQTEETAQQHSFADVGADADPDVDRRGQWIVFCSTRHNLSGDLYLKRVGGVTITQLTNDPAGNVQPAFSPSGRQIAFASDRSGNWDIWMIDVDGRNCVRITDAASHDIAFSC